MKSNERTLVILTPAFPANETEENWMPSQQSFLHSVKKLFPGIKIIILSFIYPHTTSNYLWNGINVFSFDGMKYPKIKRPLLWRKIWKKLAVINKEQKITAILSFWCSECALVGKYFGKKNSIRHFTWICGQDARKNNKMIRLIRPTANELIAKSDFLADEFYKNHDINPGYIIPNGIDPSAFPAFTGVKDIDIIGVGSLSVLKQYDLFVQIITGLKESLPNISGMLCGEGEDTERIKKMRQDLSLSENLQMTGMLSPKVAIKMMQRAKILLHPSSYEGFSMACLEALYAGAHVISFVKPMHHEIRNWHIVQTKEEMKQKALELLTDTKTIYEPVKAYSMDDSAKKMMELLGLSD
jgi:glycosyltransferase involved in cell wall biosynthesis